jgi:hypothetical protein
MTQRNPPRDSAFFVRVFNATGEDAMLYTVGFRIGEASEHVTLEAEDALEAAKYVKSEHPTASITYSRAANQEERGTEDLSASGP